MLQSNFYRVFDILPSGLITLDETKTHLQVYNTDFDAQITRLMIAGLGQANNYIGEYLTETTIDAFYNGFNSQMLLPNRYITMIMSVSYYNNDNELTTYDPTEYIYDDTAEVKCVRLLGSYPGLSRLYKNPVIIRYLTQIPEAEIQETAKQAVLLYVSEMFNNPNSYVLNGSPSPLPLTSERLLSNFKRRWI